MTALYWARATHAVTAALSFDYGARHNARELPFAAEHAARLGLRHEVVRLDFMGRLFTSHLFLGGGPIPDGHYEEATMRQTVVPFRNAVMLAVATGFAESVGAGGVVIAAHGGDHAIYPDCREDFMRAMGDAMRRAPTAASRCCGLHRDRQGGHRGRGRRLGVDFARTWSCYKGGVCIAAPAAPVSSGGRRFCGRDCPTRPSTPPPPLPPKPPPA